MIYRASYTDGRNSTSHDDFFAALAAIGTELNWSDPVYSDSFSADDGEASCVYPTQEECDTDADDGAYAPRITEIS